MPPSIPLTCAQKPTKGETWQLQRTATGFDLLDAAGELVTAIPAAEASYRFRFPSFWASVRYLEILMPEGGSQKKPGHSAFLLAVAETAS
jgi:hypothetical protein